MSEATAVGSRESVSAAASGHARGLLVPLFNVSLATAAVVVFLGPLLISQFVLAWFKVM